jgi:hypothetical protein
MNQAIAMVTSLFSLLEQASSVERGGKPPRQGGVTRRFPE